MFAKLFNMQPTNVIKIYIPRILGSVTQKTLCHTFDRLNIGKVFYVDMHRKKNENNRIYYFAFLDIELYNTPVANNLHKLLNANQLVKLVYDEEAAQYWELKKHIPRTERQTNASVTITSMSSSVMPVLYETFMQQFEKQYNNHTEDTIIDVFDYDSYISGKSYNMWDDNFNLLSGI